MDSQGCKTSLCGNKNSGADAQAYLSLRWVRMSKGAFSHVATLMLTCDLDHRYDFSPCASQENVMLV